MSMFKQAGYMILNETASGGGVTEDDMLGCNHCQRLIRKSEFQEKGAFCTKCASVVCQQCYHDSLTNGCHPWQKALEERLNLAHRIESNMRVMGLEQRREGVKG
jgi:hypothetical protein